MKGTKDYTSHGHSFENGFSLGNLVMLSLRSTVKYPFDFPIAYHYLKDAKRPLGLGAVVQVSPLQGSQRIPSSDTVLKPLESLLLAFAKDLSPGFLTLGTKADASEQMTPVRSMRELLKFDFQKPFLGEFSVTRTNFIHELSPSADTT